MRLQQAVELTEGAPPPLVVAVPGLGRREAPLHEDELIPGDGSVPPVPRTPSREKSDHEPRVPWVRDASPGSGAGEERVPATVFVLDRRTRHRRWR